MSEKAVDDNPEYSDEDLGSSNDSSVESSNDDVVIKEDLITYSKNQLIALKEVSLSTEWPSYLDEGFKNNRGHWDPDRWHQNKRRGSTPPPEEKGGNGTTKDDVSAPGNKKKDIKDRLFMAETEGIVLSPQRRSFTAGCLVSNESTTKDSDQPNNSISGTHSGIKLENLPTAGSKTERDPASLSLRPDTISNSSRRVGSGRILSREPRGPTDYDHDQRGGGDSRDRDRDRFNEGSSSSDRYGFGRNRDRDRDRNRDWYDRGGDFDGPPNRGDRSGDRGGRGGGSRADRGTSRNKNEPRGRGGGGRYARDVEPEWMSAPVNQDETFELKGFDDSPEKEVEKKRSNTTSSDNSSKTANINDPGFNIDDILHMDVIPGLANILDDNDPTIENEPSGGVQKTESISGGGSRFSQFFAKSNAAPASSVVEESITNVNNEPRRSSIIDELGTNTSSTETFMQDFIRKNKQNQQHQEQQPQQQTSIKIPSPGDPSAYFAPISPAAKTENTAPMNSLMEMLNRKGDDSDMPPLPPQVKTAEEIEANIKHLVGLQREELLEPPQKPQPEGEMSAFKKFAALVQGSDSEEKASNGNHMAYTGPHHTPYHPEPHRVSRPNVPVARPSAIPANAQTEQEILAEMALRHRHQQQQAEHVQGMRPCPPPAAPGGIGPPVAPQQRFSPPGHGGHGGLDHGGLGGPAGPGGIQPSKQEVLMMISQRRFIPEVLKTQEAISLQTAVQNGGGLTMLNTFLYQFVYGQMDPSRREILLQVIKMYQMKGAFSSDLVGPPPQQQQRPPHLHPPPSMHGDPHHTSGMSPTSPTPSAAKNLSVSPNASDQHRVPSPQEMAIHAQQIMQNALIKRKLEEQKENYRRRHEHEQMRKGTESPHLAFTPTVVMKKMAADRRDSDPKPVIPELKVSTSDINKCSSSNIVNQNIMPPPPPQGRTSPPNMLTSQQHQMLLMHQQQQQIQAQQIAAAMQVTGHAQHPNLDPRGMLMQAQAAMMGHHVGPHPIPPHQVPPPHFIPPAVSHVQHGPPGQAGHGQLSQFFSPEVLAQAQAGNAPPLPPLPTQKAMTLEEIERQASAIVRI